MVKKAVAALGYSIINRIADVPIPRNTGDFRVISRRVIEEMRFLKESHGFLRGLVSLVGFPSTFVDYERAARYSGAGNYNRFFGSLRIGFNGLFGFSTAPLSIMMWTGFGIAVASFLAALLMVFTKLILQTEYPLGIPTLTILVLFMGGVQLAGMGMLGEYLGRVYDETRARPQFIVQARAQYAGAITPRPASRRSAGDVCGGTIRNCHSPSARNG